MKPACPISRQAAGKARNNIEKANPKSEIQNPK
jgi:hypothetical protein